MLFCHIGKITDYIIQAIKNQLLYLSAALFTIILVYKVEKHFIPHPKAIYLNN